jgi:methionine-S-sulfoxide reductase
MLQEITLGGGCYWCVEAIYQQVVGVQSVVSGFSGGKVDNPSYEEVCRGTTGHAEVIKVIFEDDKVSLPELLEIFWSVHDPTTLNRQGADVGTQYRSVIFYNSDDQKKIAEDLKAKLDASDSFDKPIVTEISPLINFFKAGDYHQNYYNEHGDQPYCAIVIRPKVEKFQKVFKDKIKEA